MKSTYSIILWKKPDAKGEENCLKVAFRTFSVFQKYRTCYRPNYLTCQSKKDAINANEFEWSYSNFVDQLKRGVNKEGNRVFTNLGYSISFFSQKDEANSTGISAHVGITNTLFFDTIVINLYRNIDWNDETVNYEVESLFRELCKEYNPFWGGVCDTNLSVRFKGYLTNNRPNFLCWLNYWSEEIETEIGKKRIEKVVKKHSEMDYSNHILKIGSKPISSEVEEDVDKLIKLQDILLKKDK